MRDFGKMATTLLLGFGLLIVCLYTYLSHLPFNYTLDGLAFSAQVEKENVPLWVFFHPHHLIYTYMGKLFFVWGREHGAFWDGLVALQFLDIMTGALGVLIVFHLLVRETDDRLIAALSAAGMAFSHSYWYFSTIPGVRIFATVTPLFAWYVLTYQKNKPPMFGWAVGFAHAFAVLGHQTNLLLIPAFLGGILLLREKTFWERLRTSFYYLTALSIGVLSAYAFVGRYIYYRKNFHDFLWWASSYFHEGRWGGYFKASGFERGESAMMRAFLASIPSAKTIGESLTFGAATTIFQYTVLVLLVLLLLRSGYHWSRHRQALWVSILWIAAFVPFFIWWEPWNIEFWVSSTIPCWVLMGLLASDLTGRWKNGVLRFANRMVTTGVWTALIVLLFLYNIQGSSAKSIGNAYNFKILLGAIESNVGADDLLILDGINNVHYYLDRFQKRGYLSLYTFLRKYTSVQRQEAVSKPKVKAGHAHGKTDPWTDLSDMIKKTWKSHHKVWVLTEAVNDIDGGREQLEGEMGLPKGHLKAFFTQYRLKPVSYQEKVYCYEVVQSSPSVPSAEDTESKGQDQP